MIKCPNRPARLLLFTSLALTASLAGCSKPEEPPAASPATEPEPEPAIEPQAAPKPSAESEPKAAANIANPTGIRNVGLSTPESVLYDDGRDLYLVSNINGNPVEADGNGFITRLRPDGQVQELKWIDGSKDGVTLNAPKGMAIAGGVLYVADITAVRKFDASTGEAKGEISIEGATFLNDIAAADDGALYVSDSGIKPGDNGFEATGSAAVYRIREDKVEPVAKGGELGQPNGLLADGEDLLVVTFGSNELYRLSDGKKGETVKLPKGALDGIVRAGDGRIVVSSWEGSQLFAGKLGGEFSSLAEGISAPAGIGHDSKRNLVLVPQFNDNSVQLVPLTAAPSEAAQPAQGDIGKPQEAAEDTAG